MAHMVVSRTTPTLPCTLLSLVTRNHEPHLVAANEEVEAELTEHVVLAHAADLDVVLLRGGDGPAEEEGEGE